MAGQPEPAAYLLTQPHLPAATLAIHAFGLLDQDYPFVYIPEIDPWYRWPLSILNYLLLWTIAAGLARGWRCCAALSVWMQAQAPNIPLTREIAALPQIDPPAARFDVLPPERWTVEQRQRYTVRATNLGAQSWFTIRPARVYLHITFVGPGDADTINSRVEVRVPIDETVRPGQQLDMRVSVTAPAKEGAYRLRQQLELGDGGGPSGAPPQETRVTVSERRR